jgi:hypothetical protein
MRRAGGDTRHIDAAEPLDLPWEHLVFGADVAEGSVDSVPEGKDAA